MADTGIAIGLDIDEKSIKFAKIKQTDGDVTLLKYAIRDIPPSEDKIKSISGVLKEVFNGEKSDIPVYTSVFGQNVSLKRLMLPEMPQDELIEAIKWEARNLVPFPLENSAIDYYKIGDFIDNNTKKYDLMFAVAGEEILKFFNDISKESGIKFAGISLMPLALSALLSHAKKYDTSKVIAIIDIGAEAASINLFKGNKLNFTREITVAGDSLTKAMTGLLVADHWQLNLTYEQAEEIKLKYGIPKKDTTETTDNGIPLVHIHEMMSTTLRRLQNELQRSFDYYKEEFREEKIDNIFLTGGSAGLKNLDEFLSAALGLKVENVDPLEKVKIDKAAKIDEAKLKADSIRLPLALGLAIERGSLLNFKKAKQGAGEKFSIQSIMKMFKGGKFPAKMPANFNLDNLPKLPKTSVILSVGAAVLILGSAMYYDISLDNTKKELNKELASKRELLSSVKELSEKRDILNRITVEETHIRETLSQVTRVIPDGILLTQLQYNNDKKQIWISGAAKDTKTVGKLLKDLQDSPFFKDTTLIEARKGSNEGLEDVEFRITFILS